MIIKPYKILFLLIVFVFSCANEHGDMPYDRVIYNDDSTQWVNEFYTLDGGIKSREFVIRLGNGSEYLNESFVYNENGDIDLDSSLFFSVNVQEDSVRYELSKRSGFKFYYIVFRDHIYDDTLSISFKDSINYFQLHKDDIKEFKSGYISGLFYENDLNGKVVEKGLLSFFKKDGLYSKEIQEIRDEIP